VLRRCWHGTCRLCLRAHTGCMQLATHGGWRACRITDGLLARYMCIGYSAQGVVQQGVCDGLLSRSCWLLHHSDFAYVAPHHTWRPGCQPLARAELKLEVKHGSTAFIAIITACPAAPPAPAPTMGPLPWPGQAAQCALPALRSSTCSAAWASRGSGAWWLYSMVNSPLP
jgi:hypothetical protein